MSEQDYSQLVDWLDVRLSNSAKVKDSNDQYVDTKIFENDELKKFIDMSVTAFNSIPAFTNFTVNDVGQYADLIIQYAAFAALMSKALVEKGRLFVSVEDTFEYQAWYDRAKYIKSGLAGTARES